MTQLVKAVDSKQDSLSSILITHMLEGEKELLKVDL